jgi:peptidoglycan/LPS O-acetylase OafA/YrhL
MAGDQDSAIAPECRLHRAFRLTAERKLCLTISQGDFDAFSIAQLLAALVDNHSISTKARQQRLSECIHLVYRVTALLSRYMYHPTEPIQPSLDFVPLFGECTFSMTAEPSSKNPTLLGHGRFAELDVLRGAAALAVVIYHFTAHAQRYFGDSPFTLEAGAQGVELFFCISGFVIFWTLSRSKSVIDFAFSRFSRLYPAYWAALALSALVTMLIQRQWLWVGGYVANTTMLQGFFDIPHISDVFWTLTVELVFYFWMGVVFVTGQLSRMVPIACVWLGLSIAFGALSPAFDVPPWTDRYLLLSYIPYFMAGSMFYLIARDGWRRAYIAVISLAFVAAGIVERSSGLGLVTAAMIFATFTLAVSGRARMFVNPVTVWLGTISYSLYLTHLMVGLPSLTALNGYGVGTSTALLITLGGALLLASVITYSVERPAMEGLRAWYKGRRKPMAAHAPT